MTVRLIAESPLIESVEEVEVLALDKDRLAVSDEHRWDNFFLNGLHVTEDFMNERCSENF
jgi:virulence-associated protein VagC